MLVYNALVASQVAYGLDTLPIAQANINELDTLFYSAVRKCLKIQHSYNSRISNEEVLNRANYELENSNAKNRRLTSHGLNS